MEDNNTKKAEQSVEEHFAHEFTPKDMVSFLLGNGFTVDQIEGRIAESSDYVKTCLADSRPLTDDLDQSLFLLKNLYLKEQIKSYLRASPFMGINKGAERLGISRKVYEFNYNSLIKSGEVKFVIETPDWGDVGKNKVPLRRHIVK